MAEKKKLKNRYPLPLPKDIFDRLGYARVFSKIKLKPGYWKMPGRLEDVRKTTFKMLWGFFKYLIMPFKLNNVPVQFINMMNDLHGDFLDRSVLVFLDDILIYFVNLEEHTKHLRKVLERL